MSFLEAVIICFSKYFDIHGRATRSEYWWFVLFTIIVYFVASITSPMLFLLVLYPSITVQVRRLHDNDMSGWWAILIPIPVAQFLLIFFNVLPGTPGENRFGNHPFSDF